MIEINEKYKFSGEKKKEVYLKWQNSYTHTQHKFKIIIKSKRKSFACVWGRGGQNRRRRRRRRHRAIKRNYLLFVKCTHLDDAATWNRCCMSMVNVSRTADEIYFNVLYFYHIIFHCLFIYLRPNAVYI